MICTLLEQRDNNHRKLGWSNQPYPKQQNLICQNQKNIWFSFFSVEKEARKYWFYFRLLTIRKLILNLATHCSCATEILRQIIVLSINTSWELGLQLKLLTSKLNWLDEAVFYMNDPIEIKVWSYQPVNISATVYILEQAAVNINPTTTMFVPSLQYLIFQGLQSWLSQCLLVDNIWSDKHVWPLLLHALFNMAEYIRCQKSSIDQSYLSA